MVPKGKGKAPAPPSEPSPLLPSTSRNSEQSYRLTISRRRSITSHFTTLALFIFSVLLLVSLCVILLLRSYARSAPILQHDADPEALIRNGVRWQIGGVDVVEFDETGLRLLVSGQFGVDMDWMMGLKAEVKEVSWLHGLRKSIGNWAISTMGAITVTASHVSLYSALSPERFLLNITTPPYTAPLTPNSPDGTIVLNPFTLEVLITPTTNVNDAVDFFSRTWMRGVAHVRLDIGRIHFSGGGIDDGSWRALVKGERDDLRAFASVKIPPIPSNFPQPGSKFPPIASLVKLESYTIHPIESPPSLGLTALASVPLPIPPSYPINPPTSFPTFEFLISVPSSSDESDDSSFPIASVQSTPYTVNTSSTLASMYLPIEGSVLPLSSDAAPYLSKLVTNYLNALASPLLITPLHPISIPPIPVSFPAPPTKPQLLHNVTIKDMKVTMGKTGTDVLASGTIIADITLPEHMEDLAALLEVKKVFPDVIIFDGEPLPTVDVDIGAGALRSPAKVPDPPPLPDPLPENAFARIQPHDWLDAITLPETVHGTRTVTAEIVDAPLQVLEGRDGVFRNFISKVIFKSGALAGVRGAASVAVQVEGLEVGGNDDNTIELYWLPFEGNVWIGRKSVIGAVVRWPSLPMPMPWRRGDS